MKVTFIFLRNKFLTQNSTNLIFVIVYLSAIVFLNLNKFYNSFLFQIRHVLLI